MLAYFLAIAVAIISIIIYLTAFFSPKIHRQDDFLWSGLGLFYALILWFCAGRITGALLLGQLAAVSIIIAFIWETRKLREAIVASETELKLEGFSILDLILTLLAKIPGFSRQQLPLTQPSPPETKEIPTEEKPETPPAQEESETPELNKTEMTQEVSAEDLQLPEKEDIQEQILTSLPPKDVEEKTGDSSSTTETETEITPTPKITESGEKTEKKGLFSNLWGSLAGLTQVFGKKASPPPATTSPNLAAELDLTVEEESTSTTDTETDKSSDGEFEEISNSTTETKEQPAEEASLELDDEQLESQATTSPTSEAELDLTVEEESTSTTDTETDKSSDGEFEEISNSTTETKEQPAEEASLELDDEQLESQATTSPTSEAELDLTIEAESTSSTKDENIDTDDLTPEQVPEEDKISSLTELTETKDKTGIEQELDSFLQESEKKSKSDSSES